MEKKINHSAVFVMKRGLVFGKFMPLHQGHLVLIDFALRNCDILYVVICYSDKEPISGEIRLQWVIQELKDLRVVPIPFYYVEHELPNTSESSPEISSKWASAFKKVLPDVDVLFTSEPYGEFVAGFMQIKHIEVDKKRIKSPITASQIRANPFKYWTYIANAARPYFVKKIAIVGTESTGKTVLSEKFARHYDSVFVPEMAREVVETTNQCTYDDLIRIAELHAKTILEKIPQANRLLFVDTDLVITKSYSHFLFNKELVVSNWIESANLFDLYLFMEPDCEFIQDGTRLSIKKRYELSGNHKKFFKDVRVPIHFINGDWNQRFDRSILAIEERFFQ